MSAVEEDVSSSESAGDESGIWPDEAELVRLAQADLTAFDALYRRYVTRIYRFVYLRTGREQDAMDLTQQVFVRALDAFPRYRSRGVPFGAWLFRIARNIVTDHHRRSKTALPWDTLSESLHPVYESDPERAAVDHEATEAIRAVLGQLDQQKQELLALRFAGGLTVPEIAAIIGKPEGTVKSDLRRTLLRLREHWDED